MIGCLCRHQVTDLLLLLLFTSGLQWRNSLSGFNGLRIREQPEPAAEPQGTSDQDGQDQTGWNQHTWDLLRLTGLDQPRTVEPAEDHGGFFTGSWIRTRISTRTSTKTRIKTSTRTKTKIRMRTRTRNRTRTRIRTRTQDHDKDPGLEPLPVPG